MEQRTGRSSARDSHASDADNGNTNRSGPDSGKPNVSVIAATKLAVCQERLRPVPRGKVALIFFVEPRVNRGFAFWDDQNLSGGTKTAFASQMHKKLLPKY